MGIGVRPGAFPPEAQLTLANVYIPIGAPLRWSLVRGSVDAFVANRYAFHPLPEMAQIPR